MASVPFLYLFASFKGEKKELVLIYGECDSCRVQMSERHQSVTEFISMYRSFKAGENFRIYYNTYSYRKEFRVPFVHCNAIAFDLFVCWFGGCVVLVHPLLVLRQDHYDIYTEPQLLS